MIKACEGQLQLPQRVTSVTLPLAASMFRICGPMASFTAGVTALTSESHSARPSF